MTAIAPWLSVGDGPGALRFYTDAFGAVERYRVKDGDGRVIIARLAVDDVELWFQEDPGLAPPDGGGAIRMILTVADPDAVFAQAIAAGATEVYPVSDAHGWHVGRLADPFGHHWEVGRPLEGAKG
jgi:PhnB protein